MNTVFFSLGRNLDQRIQDMRLPDLLRNQLLTVDSVHQAHHDRILTDNRPDHFHCPRKCPVFERDNQKIHTVRLLGRPDIRAVNLPIDRASVCFEALCALPVCDHAESDIFVLIKSPNNIRADCPRSQNCN